MTVKKYQDIALVVVALLNWQIWKNKTRKSTKISLNPSPPSHLVVSNRGAIWNSSKILNTISVTYIISLAGNDASHERQNQPLKANASFKRQARNLIVQNIVINTERSRQNDSPVVKIIASRCYSWAKEDEDLGSLIINVINHPCTTNQRQWCLIHQSHCFYFSDLLVLAEQKPLGQIGEIVLCFWIYKIHI